MATLNPVKKVNASVVIDAPANVVWSTITNYNGLRSFMPGYKKSKLKYYRSK